MMIITDYSGNRKKIWKKIWNCEKTENKRRFLKIPLSKLPRIL